MKNLKLYESELYIAKLSDLKIIEITKVLTQNNINDEYGVHDINHQYFVNLKNDEENLPIIMQEVKEKGKTYLEDTLTKTKINLITHQASPYWQEQKWAREIKRKNISHIDLVYKNDKLILNHLQNPFNIIYNEGNLSLAILPQNVKPILMANKEEKQKLLDYQNNTLETRKQKIENLKEIQKQKISPYFQTETENYNIVQDEEFENFVKKYIKTLKE